MSEQTDSNEGGGASDGHDSDSQRSFVASLFCSGGMLGTWTRDLLATVQRYVYVCPGLEQSVTTARIGVTLGLLEENVQRLQGLRREAEGRHEQTVKDEREFVKALRAKLGTTSTGTASDEPMDVAPINRQEIAMLVGDRAVEYETHTKNVARTKFDLDEAVQRAEMAKQTRDTLVSAAFRDRLRPSQTEEQRRERLFAGLLNLRVVEVDERAEVFARDRADDCLAAELAQRVMQ